MNGKKTDGKIYFVEYYMTDVSVKEAEEYYNRITEHFNKNLGVTPSAARDGSDNDDYSVSSSYKKDGYSYIINYYCRGNDRASVALYCFNETEGFYGL